MTTNGLPGRPGSTLRVRGGRLFRPGDGQGAAFSRRSPVTLLSLALAAAIVAATSYSPTKASESIADQGLPNLFTTETGPFSSALHDESPSGPGLTKSSRVSGPLKNFPVSASGRTTSMVLPAKTRKRQDVGDPDPSPSTGEATISRLPSLPSEWQKAELTWYDGYKLTASGERYDRNSRTVAVMYRHGTRRPRLPFGTVIEIRVTDEAGNVLSQSAAKVNNTGSHKPRGAGWWFDGTPLVFKSHAPLKRGRLIVEWRVVR